jgi:hypothetical protein
MFRAPAVRQSYEFFRSQGWSNIADWFLNMHIISAKFWQILDVSRLSWDNSWQMHDFNKFLSHNVLRLSCDDRMVALRASSGYRGPLSTAVTWQLTILRQSIMSYGIRAKSYNRCVSCASFKNHSIALGKLNTIYL